MTSVYGISNIPHNFDYNKANNRTKNLIKTKDTDGDHKLSIDELNVKTKVFNRIDNNEDGLVGRIELNRFHTKKHINARTEELINKKDSNDDGKLSIDEMELTADIFIKIDKNEDGLADKTELNRFFSKKHINAGTTKMINNKDTNDDGMLTVDEMGLADDVFAEIDKNEDGLADRKEINMYKRTNHRIYDAFQDNWEEPDNTDIIV